jgi:formylmethanofuran dehydrogenase subunit E
MSMMMAKLACSKCGKRLWKKSARLIDGRVICSACLFPKLDKGRPNDLPNGE